MLYHFVDCPKCHHTTVLPVSLKRFQVSCPSCNTALLVPPPSADDTKSIAQPARLWHRQSVVAVAFFLAGGCFVRILEAVCK
jgi:hypothetical protein